MLIVVVFSINQQFGNVLITRLAHALRTAVLLVLETEFTTDTSHSFTAHNVEVVYNDVELRQDHQIGL